MKRKIPKLESIIIFCIAILIIIQANCTPVSAQQKSGIETETSNHDSLGIDKGLLALIKEYRDLVLSGKTELAANKKKIIIELGQNAYPHLVAEINNLIEGKPARSQISTNNPPTNNSLETGVPTGGSVTRKTNQPTIPNPLPNASTGPKKNVDVITVPNYKQKTLLTLFKAGYTGVYIAFVDASQPANIKTHVYKFYGFNSWATSIQPRQLWSVFPLDIENSNSDVLSYYWLGTMTKQEHEAEYNRSKTLGTRHSFKAQGFGMFNQGNSSPSFFYYPPIVTHGGPLCSDYSSRPSIWYIGHEDYSNVNDNSVPVEEILNPSSYLYISSGSDRNSSHLFDKYPLPIKQLSSFNTILEPSEDDKFVWIGSGTKLIHATSSGRITTTDLATIGATGRITKLIDAGGNLWILCGKDIYRKNGENLSKIYTIKNTQMPSIAVAGSTVYCNDGNRITAFGKVESFMGSGPLTENNRAAYDELATNMGSCQLELLKSSTSSLLYLFDRVEGKIYMINRD